MRKSFFFSSFFFIFGCTGSSLLHTGFFLIVESGSYSCGAQTLGAQASVVGAQGLILALGPKSVQASVVVAQGL